MATFQDLIDQGLMGVPSPEKHRRAQSVRDYARDALKGGLIAHLHDPAVHGKWFDFCEAVAMCAFDIGKAMADEEEKRQKRNEEAR